MRVRFPPRASYGIRTCPKISHSGRCEANEVDSAAFMAANEPVSEHHTPRSSGKSRRCLDHVPLTPALTPPMRLSVDREDPMRVPMSFEEARHVVVSVPVPLDEVVMHAR
jgi:hypothetical protein